MSLLLNTVVPAVTSGGGSTLWTPSEITTEYWYDMSDTDTITHVGNAVSQVDDKSGNNRHATQGTAGQQPFTNTDTVNGLNALAGDGDNYWMNIPDISFSDGAYLFWIFTADNDTSFNVGGVFNNLDRFTDGLTYAQNFRTVRLDSQSASVPSNGTSLLSYAALSTGPNYDIRVDGAYTVQSTASFTFAGSGHTHMFINLKTSTPPLNMLNGNICECLALNEYPSLDTIERLEGYGAHKWGQESKLPGGHTYKSAPPTV